MNLERVPAHWQEVDENISIGWRFWYV